MACVKHAAMALVLLAGVLLLTPAVARAHGDPAGEVLRDADVFLPADADVDSSLADTVRAANRAGFRIKVAVIATRYDLGSEFSLYNKPQTYAEDLALELVPRFRDRVLVVMPRGFGVTFDARPAPGARRALARVPPPGAEVDAEVASAAAAVRRLAAASGYRLAAAGSGGSATRDRITLAAAATMLLALAAGFALFRRSRTL
jgi:hypothetical protein